MVAWYYCMLYAARLAFWVLVGGVKGVHKDNVPKKGPLIVAPNHVSYFDPPAVACGTNRRLRFMAKDDLFKAKILGPLIRSLGAFPVSRGEGDTEAIRTAIAAIESGEALLIFPEGTRSDGTFLRPVNRGVTMLAKRTGALVLPVAVIGTHIAWPKGQKKIKRHKIKVVYGLPFTYEDMATGKDERENRALFAAELQKRIADLCNDNGLPVQVLGDASELRKGDKGDSR